MYVFLNSSQNVLILTIEFSRTVRFEVQHKHDFKSKTPNLLFYLMYKHLCDMALNFNVVFHL